MLSCQDNIANKIHTQKMQLLGKERKYQTSKEEISEAKKTQRDLKKENDKRTKKTCEYDHKQSS